MQKSYRILLVEDNPGDARLIQEFLKNRENLYTIDHTKDGVEAINFLKDTNNRPDLIILDLNLPRKNGKEVLQEIKTDDNFKKIPIVVLTTSNAETDVSSAYTKYANSYLIKPVDIDEFSKLIDLLEAYWFKLVRLPTNEK